MKSMQTIKRKTIIIIIFYSGMGYIIGSNVAKAFHDWKYALRVSVKIFVINISILFYVVIRGC